MGGDSAAVTPTHVPTMACAWNLSPAPHACCPPLSHVHRLRCEGGKGVLPPNMCPLQPWVCVGGESAPQPPTTPPTLPPRYVPTMRPRRHPHAIRHSHMYVDCGARPKQGCCPPTCARSSPGCVWGLCCGRPYPPPRHSRQECQNVCVACVPDPTRTLSATLLCMLMAGWGLGRGVACQHVPAPALGVWVGGVSGAGTRTSHTRTHVPTVVCACHASLVPSACCPQVYYV